ncbi:hypothetical protein NM208_g1060 [Fusarium decemcellulare]|uniref:Uncharacterized protein n=1 Tax=Fusarium decemcellulare TaxID=57161 RepID=A0ACC1SXF3_9HYPO|nr:hypothetical protein NM208_g1060 [Fusarium decemcellulare]
MPLPQFFTLNTGYTIPAIGLGTWQSKPNEVKTAVETALKIGYRHIDAASIYGNESKVGNGIKASDVDRSDIFVNFPGDLGMNMHFPVSFAHLSEAFPVNPETEEIWVTDVPIADSWKAMEDLVKMGKVRTIGVSNFTRQRIEDLMETATVLPAANQIEGHPYLQQPAFPMGNNIYNLPRCVDDPEIIAIAKDLDKEPGQVLVSWSVQRGSSVLPKSVTPERIANNFEVFELP